ncbi:Uncharacterised protein [Mycobacteroides abscessus]|nr:Uncharacterised protein [Mycobacteroides abscessus]
MRPPAAAARASCGTTTGGGVAEAAGPVMGQPFHVPRTLTGRARRTVRCARPGDRARQALPARRRSTAARGMGSQSGRLRDSYTTS